MSRQPTESTDGPSASRARRGSPERASARYGDVPCHVTVTRVATRVNQTLAVAAFIYHSPASLTDLIHIPVSDFHTEYGKLWLNHRSLFDSSLCDAEHDPGADCAHTPPPVRYAYDHHMRRTGLCLWQMHFGYIHGCPQGCMQGRVREVRRVHAASGVSSTSRPTNTADAAASAQMKRKW